VYEPLMAIQLKEVPSDDLDLHKYPCRTSCAFVTINPGKKAKRLHFVAQTLSGLFKSDMRILVEEHVLGKDTKLCRIFRMQSCY